MSPAVEVQDTHIVRVRRKFVAILVAMGAVVALQSCGGDETAVTPPAPDPSRPTEISIDPETFVVAAGSTVRLGSEVRDQRSKIIFAAQRAWTSSDPAVAIVDTSGVVTGIREGTATITVTAGPVSASATGTIRSQDRAALISLLNSAGAGTGESWTNRENWGSDEAVGSWYGVEANADGRVTALRLSDNGLSGQLPDDLGDLAFLTELHVDGNEGLSGPIPVSMSELGLQQFHYGGTMLCIVRDEGFQAWLNAIPTIDGDFIACNEERSDLMKLHDAMGGESWTNSANWGTSAPLDNWYGIAVNSAGRVTQITLSRNNLSGKVPPEIQYFPYLRHLRLGNNELEGEVPPEIGKLTELQFLSVDGNNFTGPIPPEIGNLVKLQHLWMGGSRMSGPIPPELGNLTSLLGLNLYEASFDGSIPEEFGALTELSQLYIRDTRISGPIPAALGNLEKLRFLDVSGNRLSGPLPGELGNFGDLVSLDLSDNRITGPLPEEFGQLRNLRTFQFRNNMIDGPLPAQFGQLGNLQSISADNNMLSGPLPAELGELDDLVWLHVQNNPDLSGPLPAELTSLLILEELIAYGTGLCAPAEPEWQTWLNDVVAKWRVRPCGAEGSAEAHLIQAVQSTEYPVPLVAGRSALLRVFVMSEQETTENIPPVRATFFVNGTEVHKADIPAGSSPIPTEVQVGELNLSANVEIPADVIQPGLEMVVEVDPDRTVDAALGVRKRIPAEGRATVEVREVPPMYLTLIPFVSTADNNLGAVTFVGDATRDDDIFFETRTLLPLSTFELRKHEMVTVNSNSVHAMLRAVQRIRTMEAGTGHWMGLIANPAGAGGTAYIGRRTTPARGKVSVSGLNAGTIAHELGHNLSLRHADCGNPANTDTTFPYSSARTGVWGYDPRDGGSLVPPDQADHMSYCDPAWVSDYYFTNALRFRLVDTTEVQVPLAERTLLVSGGASADGAVHLDPAFVVATSPVVPVFEGPYQLTGRRADGSELFSLSFDMQEVWDGDGRSGFTFALPAQAEWELELASLLLTGPGGSVEVREGSEPPMAIMRDPATGQVRAILRTLPAGALAPGALDALAPERGLDIMVSDGLPSVVAWRR